MPPHSGRRARPARSSALSPTSMRMRSRVPKKLGSIRYCAAVILSNHFHSFCPQRRESLHSLRAAFSRGFLMPANAAKQIVDLLGPDAENLLTYKAKGFPAEKLHLPGPDFVDRVVSITDRPPAVLRSFQSILNHGRLAGTGYVSVLPVDQGIEHSAGASFAKNPIYFDGENIVKLAIEGGCNAVASTLGVLGSVARKYAHKIPFLLKINHNEFLSYPNRYDQITFTSVKQP